MTHLAFDVVGRRHSDFGSKISIIEAIVQIMLIESSNDLGFAVSAPSIMGRPISRHHATNTLPWEPPQGPVCRHLDDRDRCCGPADGVCGAGGDAGAPLVDAPVPDPHHGHAAGQRHIRRVPHRTRPLDSLISAFAV